VPSCTKLGERGQFSHTFSGEVYDFYSVSPKYFGYTLFVCMYIYIYREREHQYNNNNNNNNNKLIEKLNQKGR
jgi:hypothetical protein